MSGNYMRQWVKAFREADLPPSWKAVGLWAAQYADYETGERVRPGLDLLVADSGFSRNTVKSALRGLVEAGWFDHIHEGGRGHGDADEYSCVVPAIDPDIKGSMADPIKGSMADSKGSTTDAKGSMADSKGSTVDPHHPVPPKITHTPPKVEALSGKAERQEKDVARSRVSRLNRINTKALVAEFNPTKEPKTLMAMREVFDALEDDPSATGDDFRRLWLEKVADRV